jgi:hypothetical protein
MKFPGLATVLALALTSTAGLALGSSAGQSEAAPAQGATCGGPGLPACPLQAWMRANIAAPLAANNSGALAVALEKTAKLSPDASWGSWSTIAAQGAAAAKKGDVAGARASCKACHEAWREKYKQQYRQRPVPR